MRLFKKLFKKNPVQKSETEVIIESMDKLQKELWEHFYKIEKL